MRVTVSSSHIVSAAPPSSGGGLLTLFLCSSVRFLSWETVLHKLLHCESFPRAAALHELHGVQSFRNRLLQLGSPTGSQALPANLLWCGLLSPWVRRSWQEPAPARGSQQCHSLLQASTCSGMGSLPWATGGDLLHRGPPCTAGAQPASPWSSTQAARENSAPATRASLPPPSSLTVVSAELFLSHRLTPPSRLPFHHSFLPLLNYVITEALPPSLIGLALAWAHLQAGWHWLYQTWGKLLAASHRSHTYSHLAMQTHNSHP